MIKSSFFSHSPPPRKTRIAPKREEQRTLQDAVVKSTSEGDGWASTMMALGAAASALASISGAGPATAAPVESFVQSEQAEPGTLIVNDFFDTRAGESHGNVVVQSSRELGFRGPVLQLEAQKGETVKKAERFYSRLDNRNFTPQEMRDFTYDYILNRQMGSLESAASELDGLSGVHNTGFNLSRGWGKAQIMDSLYSRVRMAWDASAHPQSQVVGERRLRKLAPAFGLDADAILTGGAEERGAFQRELLNLIDEASADQRLDAAQKHYDRAVTDFESRNNSVLVAAGNSGEVLEMMAADAPLPTLAKDFFNNRLASPQTTTVGSTRRQGASESVAAYTNPDSGIDLYADGDINGAFGTSFATPRVAAVVTRLHQENPTASSDQVQDMLISRFGETLADYGDAPVRPALNEAAAQEWLLADGLDLSK